MKVLGIETSCDETAVAIIDEERNIHVNLVKAQLKEHVDYAGVVPEIAARAHLDYLDMLLPEALKQSGLDWSDIDGIAVTAGPGLIGGVIVGVMAAKAISLAHDIPLMPINHLEGHLLTPRLIEKDLSFPYLTLLVSGGHSQIVIAHELGRYERLATTVDDAVGEAFDKSAKVMGLGYPGGPMVEKMAAKATDPNRFSLPRPTLKDHALNLSLSGLKTAVRRHAEKHTIGGVIAADVVADLCAGLQEAIGDILCDRVSQAIDIYKEKTNTPNPSFVVSGGVAANMSIRNRLESLCVSNDVAFYAPPLKLCGDNAAMIAWAGIEHFKAGTPENRDFSARPRWPLDEGAEAVLGSANSKSGVKV